MNDKEIVLYQFPISAKIGVSVIFLPIIIGLILFFTEFAREVTLEKSLNNLSGSLFILLVSFFLLIRFVTLLFGFL